MNSLVMTVKNERGVIEKWYRSISEQVQSPDEIVVVDGGSDDGTLEYLQETAKKDKRMRIFEEPGNIAHGRNFAVKQATGQVVVVTDAGCVYDKNWFKEITTPFHHNKAWSATAFAPWFEENDKMLTYLIASSTIPASSEFKKNWLPSSRSVAFRKDRWVTSGGYPEWIPFCEDVLFDMKLLKKEGWPAFVREPLVFWRPRTTLKSYFRQLFNYTRSEGHAGLNNIRQFVRFLVYLSSVIFLLLSFTASSFFIYPILVGMLIYMLKFWLRLSSFTEQKKFFFRAVAFLLVPMVVAFGDLAKMDGWLFGVFERKTGRVGSDVI